MPLPLRLSYRPVLMRQQQVNQVLSAWVRNLIDCQLIGRGRWRRSSGAPCPGSDFGGLRHSAASFAGKRPSSPGSLREVHVRRQKQPESRIRGDALSEAAENREGEGRCDASLHRAVFAGAQHSLSKVSVLPRASDLSVASE